MIVTVPSLKGPYSLNSGSVAAAIPEKIAGAYVVGNYKASHIEPLLVGRSEDLAAQLLKYISSYASFAFAAAFSPRVAYQMECEMYHAWKPRDNPAHPAKARDSNWECPVCRQ
jgi:hypothetical protein